MQHEYVLTETFNWLIEPINWLKIIKTIKKAPVWSGTIPSIHPFIQIAIWICCFFVNELKDCGPMAEHTLSPAYPGTTRKYSCLKFWRAVACQCRRQYRASWIDGLTQYKIASCVYNGKQWHINLICMIWKRWKEKRKMWKFQALFLNSFRSSLSAQHSVQGPIQKNEQKGSSNVAALFCHIL